MVLVLGRCKDNLRTEICGKYKPLCTYFKIVREVCAETCGKCERKCQATLFDFRLLVNLTLSFCLSDAFQGLFKGDRAVN